jgi:hypothetical protein
VRYTRGSFFPCRCEFSIQSEALGSHERHPDDLEQDAFADRERLLVGELVRRLAGDLDQEIGDERLLGLPQSIRRTTRNAGLTNEVVHRLNASRAGASLQAAPHERGAPPLPDVRQAGQLAIRLFSLDHRKQPFEPNLEVYLDRCVNDPESQNEVTKPAEFIIIEFIQPEFIGRSEKGEGGDVGIGFSHVLLA